ncbi:MAG: alpha-amylase family glycosyl hydrolase [Deltaproteobacteria bacterium]|jgi:starch synthase (maltosyl-transferring)|nr:alpha-amylase family glycosyl hydrolase [Deltaproteobacteria bacterium]
MKSLYIYNIFPRLAGKMSNWPAIALHARKLGFNSIYLNPFHETGLGDSLYAVKNYFKVDSAFHSQKSATGLEELQEIILQIRQMGIKVIMDLVINHTAVNNPLTKTHPEWYRLDDNGKILHPSAIDPADSRKITVWGDLYEIDNLTSKAGSELWNFWKGVIETYTLLGFRGFRADAAYKVPAQLWKLLVEHAQKIAGEKVYFLAETLGCRLEEVESLKEADFDYLYNSSKYWNFDQNWALQQHTEFQKIAPSVSFPESHDTLRLAKTAQKRTQVQKQRYALALFFSKAVQITMGFEYGWTRKCNVVKSKVTSLEPETMDITSFISRANKFAQETPLFNEEGSLEALSPFNQAVFILKKSSNYGKNPLYAFINKDWDQSQTIELDNQYKLMPLFRKPEGWQLHPQGQLLLEPAEIVFGRKINE